MASISVCISTVLALNLVLCTWTHAPPYGPFLGRTNGPIDENREFLDSAQNIWETTVLLDQSILPEILLSG